MTTQGTLARGGSAARFAVVGGLALLIIAACASAFSMLVWDPVSDPTPHASSALVSSRSGQVQPDHPRRVEDSAYELGPKYPVFFDPTAKDARATRKDQ
jgi:hypothetical protein